MFMEQILEIFQRSKFLYLILMVQIIFTMKYFVSIRIFLSLSLKRFLFKRMGYFLIILANINQNNGFYLDREFLIFFNRF